MDNIPSIRGFAATQLIKPENRNTIYMRGTDDKDGLELAYDANFNVAASDVYGRNDSGLPTRASAMSFGFSFMRARLALVLRVHIGTSDEPGGRPKEWDGISGAQLEQAVWNYGHATISSFGGAHMLPAAVILADDITGGVVYPDGKLDGSGEAFARFETLVKKFIDGVKFACPSTVLALQWNKPGDAEGAEKFFTSLIEAKLDFGAIAVPVASDGFCEKALAAMSAVAAKLGKYLIASPCSVSSADASAQAEFIKKLDSFASDEGDYAAFKGYILDDPFEKGGKTSMIGQDGAVLEAFAPRERPADPFPMPPYSRKAPSRW